ncbi:MAG: MarR family transcriptional regulator [Gemmatimonadetes bacterium]|nr:MarR family transcriptional regulator [Gemmatimonadota bacterium]
MTATATVPQTPKRPTPEPATATALKLFVVLARAQQAISERVEGSLVSHGLTHTEFAILEALYHKGPLLLGEVQRKILVSSGGITFLVDKLANRGLVERRLCPSDRRARYAALTRKGEALMAQIFPAHADAIREAMAGLSRAEQKQATALLKQLGLAASAASPESAKRG